MAHGHRKNYEIIFKSKTDYNAAFNKLKSLCMNPSGNFENTIFVTINDAGELKALQLICELHNGRY